MNEKESKSTMKYHVVKEAENNQDAFDLVTTGENVLMESAEKPLNKLAQNILSETKGLVASTLDDLMGDKTALIPYKHVILIDPSVDPIKQRTRGIPFSYREEFKAKINEMLRCGMIRESNSPVRLVKKERWNDSTLC